MPEPVPTLPRRLLSTIGAWSIALLVLTSLIGLSVRLRALPGSLLLNLANIQLERTWPAPVYATVEPLLEQSLAWYPGNAAAHRALGTVYARSGRPELARPEFEASLKADPGNAMSHYELAALFRSANEIEAARREWRLAGAYGPLILDIWESGLADLEKNELDKAEKAFRDVTELAGQRKDRHWASEGFRALGNVYSLRGDMGMAVTSYAKALEFEQNPLAMVQLGQLYARKTDSQDQAVTLIQEALALKPHDYFIRLALADTYRDLKQYESGARAYLKALQFAPRGDGLAARGGVSCLIQADRASQAIALAKTLIHRVPTDPELHGLLGEAYTRTGQTELAEFENLQAQRLRRGQ